MHERINGDHAGEILLVKNLLKLLPKSQEQILNNFQEREYSFFSFLAILITILDSSNPVNSFRQNSVFTDFSSSLTRKYWRKAGSKNEINYCNKDASNHND